MQNSFRSLSREIILWFVTLTALLPGIPALASDVKTLSNETYGFKVDYPSQWNARKQMFGEPFPDIEAFKSDRVTIGGAIDTGRDGPLDWNSVAFNTAIETQVPAEGSTAPPAITIYAHKAQAKSFDEFSGYLKELEGVFYMPVISARKVTTKSGLSAYDYVYGAQYDKIAMLTRLVVIFHDGIRYGLTYTELSKKAFDANEKPFNDVADTFAIGRK